MRYYLYRDIDLLKEIYSQFVNLRLDLDVIEHIDARNHYEEQAFAMSPENKLSEKCEVRLRSDGRVENGNSVTTISEYANIQDVKEIYNKRFYHNLINDIRNKKITSKGLCCEVGKLNCVRYSEEQQDKFIEVNGIYVWYDNEKMSNEMSVISRITNEIEVIGITIKDKDKLSPKVIKAIAIFVDTERNKMV